MGIYTIQQAIDRVKIDPAKTGESIRSRTRLSFRSVMLNLHLWTGLAAALLLLLIGGSGALLVFETQIDQALNSKLAKVAPSGKALSLNQLISLLERQYPGHRVLGFDISEANDVSYSAYLQPPSGDGFEVAVNQYDGKALGVWDDRRFSRKLHGFHTHLLAGKPGSAIVGWSAVFLLFLSLSGLILWWRTKIIRVHFQTSGPKFQYDLHSTVGIFSSLCLLTFALTGILIHWEDAARSWANQVSNVPASTPQKPATPAPGTVPLDADRLLALARAAVPGARPTAIDMSDGPASPVLVILKFPEDHTPIGRTRVLLDAYSGSVLSLTNSREAPPAVAYMTRLNREIHTGDLGGWPTRIVAAIFSASLPLLAITGPLLWWQRRQRD